jgi:hypothetical protein
MKIYVSGVKDVELESSIVEQQLIVMVDAMQNDLAFCQIVVSQEGRTGLLDLRDIDVARTLPDVLFPRVSVLPELAATIPPPPLEEMAVVAE